MILTLNPFITKATDADIEKLMAISSRTFVDTYGHVNTEQNMQSYLSTYFSEQATTSQLKESGTQFYLLALEDKTIGYLKLNSGAAQTDQREENTLEIERIYVLKEFQGKGFGKLLIEKAIEVANVKQVDYLWLGFWEQNTAALAFYRRLGFIEYGRHIFMLGNDEQMDLMMKLDIK